MRPVSFPFPVVSVGRFAIWLGLLGIILAAGGCGRDVAKEASQSDANGYLCERCGGKFYTKRSVFLAARCPRCGQDGLVEVVAYICPKDQHLTLRARSAERNGSGLCERCQGPLGGMVLPREKDLKTWGATKVQS